MVREVGKNRQIIIINKNMGQKSSKYILTFSLKAIVTLFLYMYVNVNVDGDVDVHT